MNKQPTITSEQPSKQPAAGELTDHELDKVTGGDGKTTTKPTTNPPLKTGQIFEIDDYSFD